MDGDDSLAPVITATDACIAQLVAAQHGVVTRAQLFAAGISRHVVDRRIRGGYLVALHRCVYHVATVPMTPWTRAAAALLAAAGTGGNAAAGVGGNAAAGAGANAAAGAGANAAAGAGGNAAAGVGGNAAAGAGANAAAGAGGNAAAGVGGNAAAALLAAGGVDASGVAASHRTAAALRGLLPPADGPTDVLGQRVCRLPGVRVHRMRVSRDEVTRLRGLPVTTRARTLLDLAAAERPRELEQALATAERLDPRSRDKVCGLLERYPRHPGAGRLRRLLRWLDATGARPTFVRSEAEEVVVRMVRSAALPPPRVNVRIAGFEVDFVWESARLVLEVDGFAWHGSAEAFQSDRRRDRALVAAGYQVLRVSWEQITRERDVVLATIAMALARGQFMAEAAAAMTGRLP